MRQARRRRVEPLQAETQGLLSLPSELIQAHILPRLDAISLAKLEAAQSCFRGYRLDCERAAEHALLARCGGDQDFTRRHRLRSWKERLHLEDCAVGFDVAAATAAGFRFQPAAADGSGSARVCLAGMGPKLLTSSESTAGGRTLRWRMQVRVNTAVEFGVVPEALVGRSDALHKAPSVRGDSSQRAVGFASKITAGSTLHFAAPVMDGSIVEVVACAGRVEFLVTQPARAVHWVNGQAKERDYRGPQEVRLIQDFPAHFDVRLALTCYARGAFQVLHHVPGLTPAAYSSPPRRRAAYVAPPRPPPPPPLDRLEAGLTCPQDGGAAANPPHVWAAGPPPQVPWQHFAALPSAAPAPAQQPQGCNHGQQLLQASPLPPPPLQQQALPPAPWLLPPAMLSAASAASPPSHAPSPWSVHASSPSDSQLAGHSSPSVGDEDMEEAEEASPPLVATPAAAGLHAAAAGPALPLAAAAGVSQTAFRFGSGRGCGAGNCHGTSPASSSCCSSALAMHFPAGESP